MFKRSIQGTAIELPETVGLLDVRVESTCIGVRCAELSTGASEKQRRDPGPTSGRSELLWSRGLRRLRVARGGLIAAMLAVPLATTLTACGGSNDHGPVAVRVGGVTIGRAAVAHWAAVMRRGGSTGVFRQEVNGTPRQRAVGFLISSSWLIREARQQGHEVSDDAVDMALRERKEANGSAEFSQSLAATGQTLDDVKLELEAELSAAAIRRQLAARAARIGQQEISSFYLHNRARFRTTETRQVELVENLSSPAAAYALIDRIGSGSRFSKIAYHEALARKVGHSSSETPDKAMLADAIFAAPPGVVSRPMRLNKAWTVFIVKKITPSVLKPLSQVREEVLQLLTARRRRAITARFYIEFRNRWTGETSCSAGYVTQGCAQYTGPLVSEESMFAGG